MIRSIRFTLTLWYVGILAIILCSFSGFVYLNVTANLEQDINHVLASQAEGVADAIFAFWKARETTVRPSEKRLPSLVIRWANETGELETERPIRLIDRNGRPLEASGSFSKLELPITQVAMTQARGGRAVYETFSLLDHRVHLITYPVIEGRRVLYFVQVAASLRQADASLKRLRLWFLWLIPIVVLVTSAVGWFLASMALRPVGRIILKAQRIGAEHLHERIDLPRTGDELEQLAVTFNNMLTRLEQAFRRLRQFSAAASHELRTPLTIMKGELEVALRKPREAQEYQRVLRAHLEALNEMTHVVEELLTLARSETAKGAVEWRPVELGELARRVRDSFSTIAKEKKVAVEIPVDEPVWVRGERRLLERLIANLLDNALKHTLPQGSVTLKPMQHNHQAYLVVQDTGSGIPPEKLPTLFDQFFSERSTSDGAHSTGLGLGLCRWIAEAHQGRIEATSTFGQGATLTVVLPLLSLTP